MIPMLQKPASLVNPNATGTDAEILAAQRHIVGATITTPATDPAVAPIPAAPSVVGYEQVTIILRCSGGGGSYHARLFWGALAGQSWRADTAFGTIAMTTAAGDKSVTIDVPAGNSQLQVVVDTFAGGGSADVWVVGNRQGG